MKSEGELEKFIKKLEIENPNPKKLSKIVIRKPKFNAGDCLSIKLSNGLYGAAIVLKADETNPEDGKNLIGVLDYLSDIKPNLAVFEKQEWLILNHHNYNNFPDLAWYSSWGYRKCKGRFEVVGNSSKDLEHPAFSERYANWGYLGEQVINQRIWNKQNT